MSLTSVPCKLMERIVLKRLESHVESNQLLDPQKKYLEDISQPLIP